MDEAEREIAAEAEGEDGAEVWNAVEAEGTVEHPSMPLVMKTLG
jgi:hypothetical protein